MEHTWDNGVFRIYWYNQSIGRTLARSKRQPGHHHDRFRRLSLFRAFRPFHSKVRSFLQRLHLFGAHFQWHGLHSTTNWQSISGFRVGCFSLHFVRCHLLEKLSDSLLTSCTSSSLLASRYVEALVRIELHRLHYCYRHTSENIRG